MRTRAPQPKSFEVLRYHGVYQGLAQLDQFAPGSDPRAAACERARNVAANKFTFLNETRSFGDAIDWNEKSASQLWRFNLHYFSYTEDLLIWSALGAMDEAYQAFRRLVTSWIEANQLLAGDAWHPYTISIRLPHWLSAAACFAKKLDHDKPFHDLLLKSIYGQGRILRAELELDLGGNHLLENLRALIWLGLSFQGPEAGAWLSHALSFLEKEIKEQIPADGGHFERNPGYHLVVLKDLVEIGLLLRRNRGSSPEWLDDGIRRMLEFLVSILQPDSNVPLLKDSSYDSNMAPRDLIATGALYLDDASLGSRGDLGLWSFLLFGENAARKCRSWQAKQIGPRCPASIALSDSGFYVMRDDSNLDYMIVDAGKPGPEYLPGHAHADMFSFELMADGRRMIVDSGVYEYRSGPWRDFFRSTRAHNTVEVAGENQSEVWSSFRVARRANPGPVKWDVNSGYTLMQAQHDGYKRLPCRATHERTIVWKPGKFWLVADTVDGVSSSVSRSYLHFNPVLKPVLVEPNVWLLEGAVTPMWVITFGSMREEVVAGVRDRPSQGWYSERFGEMQPNSVLIMTRERQFPMVFGYLITRQRPRKSHYITSHGETELLLDWPDVTHALTVAHGSASKFS
jgi:uncharacterized heparinase superfamily protein